MLTADLVKVTTKGTELKLTPLDAKRRAKAEEIARAYIDVFESHVGRTRDELEETLEGIEVEPRDRLLAKGLAKLLEDRSELEASSALDPVHVRDAVFELAAKVRRELADDGEFDRTAVLGAVASRFTTDVDAIEAALFADLRGAHTLRAFSSITPHALVAAWETGRAQAVLLRAVRVRVAVFSSTPAGYRALFRKLKFHRLLHTITKAEAGYVVEIDGPMSLFESVTKYGLELATLVPVLDACDRYVLEADVRWEAGGLVRKFQLEGGLMSSKGRDGAALEAARLPDEVAELVEKLEGLRGVWSVAVADQILELPGVGHVIPDLVFTRESPKQRVFLEVMGHWSRAAVWKRVELVERGLGAPVVFAVSTRLRVSEEALPDEVPGALYVYKGTMSAKAVLEKVEAVAERAPAWVEPVEDDAPAKPTRRKRKARDADAE
ncbi:DUF790 family protein [Myxococcota bacterium]|nr:DUF790 family protein [Myxococcota bacterium]